MVGTIYIILAIVAIFCIYLVSLPVTREPFQITNLKETLQVVNPDFAKIDIRESTTSYTEDKSIIYLCIKDENGALYPLNTLVYVALHEIAHFINKEDFGHTPAFNKIFNKLLCDAAKKGIYNPAMPHSDFYCGIDIRNISPPTCSIESLGATAIPVTA